MRNWSTYCRHCGKPRGRFIDHSACLPHIQKTKPGKSKKRVSVKEADYLARTLGAN